MRKEISAPKAVVPKSAPRGDNMEAPIPEQSVHLLKEVQQRSMLQRGLNKT